MLYLQKNCNDTEYKNVYKCICEPCSNKFGEQCLKCDENNCTQCNPGYFLDNSKLFIPVARKEDRSIMNATFKTGNDELDAKFVSEAKANGLVNLKGHRSVGGMRASIYNAMPKEGIEKLVDFMKKFEMENK